MGMYFTVCSIFSETSIGTDAIQSDEKTNNDKSGSKIHALQVPPETNDNMSETISIAESDMIPSASAQATMKRLKAQKRVTKTFFIVGVIFISIAFPVTLTASILSIPLSYGEEWYFSEMTAVVFLLLRVPYCFIALMNPFLYAFSNPMVKKRVATLFQKFCCCRCCCCCRTNNANQISN